MNRMRSLITPVLLTFIVILSLMPTRTIASTPMRYIYSAPESSLDRRYVYHWDILKTALEKTKAQYGPYVMQPSTFMTEKRQAFEMRKATGKLNVMYLSTTPDLERDLIPVRIPVDKNLGGYCVFLIRKDEQARFKSVRTLDDLRHFTYGLGLGWIDVGILANNHLKVVSGSNYDGLFYMLANRRMDIFLRAAVEVLDEYDERKAKIPNLCIEDSLILYYPLPMYFWFPKTAEGRKMADRVREGMLKMIDDGTYNRIFFAYQGYKIERLHLKSRRIFKIDNPYLGPQTPFGDKRLWFDPIRDKVPAANELETH